MKTTKSPCEIQAEKFLEDHSAKMEVKFLHTGKYFPDDDKESRDIYEITLIREGKDPYIFTFGQSLFHSKNESTKRRIAWERKNGKTAHVLRNPELYPQKPTAYDVLSTITKDNPGTFDEFCSDFGYNSDSRKAEKIYFDVQREWSNANRLFWDCLEELQEIS